MGTKWSSFTAATTLADADQLVGIQGGVNKTWLWSKIRSLFVASPTDGAALRYDSTAADWILEDKSGYRTVNTSRYTAAPSGTTILMSDTSDMAVGLPLKYVISGTTYYGLVNAVVANTSITVAGASLSANLTSLAVGKASQVVELPIFINATGYAFTTQDILATIGNQYLRWEGPKAHLVSWQATHRTATAPAVNVKVNGTVVSAAAVTLSATAGTWTRCTLQGIATAAYTLNRGDVFEVAVTTAVASPTSNYLSLILVLVLE